MEAQLPIAYGTALVLILIILLVNLLANALRKYLRRRLRRIENIYNRYEEQDRNP